MLFAIPRPSTILFSLAILFVSITGTSACNSTPNTQLALSPSSTTTLAPAPSATHTATLTPTRAATMTRTVTVTRTPFPVTPVRPTVARPNTPTRTPQAQRTQTPRPSPTLTSNPTQVSVQRNGKQFQLLVNGRPTYITGMNYNVNYTELPEDEQLARHRQDFKIMRDAGVNAIIGWGIYDETTLQVAQEFGIGVIMPFELDPDGAYENEDYRNEIKSNFRDYVLRFRGMPAVWGWNPGGDELIYRMKSEEHRTVDKLQMAADLELDLAQIAYALDPKHINVIKEPRDWYIKYLGGALQTAKNEPGFQNLAPSLVYGVNVYGHTDDIALALGNAKLTLTDQLGIAMLVSEFGPFNSPREERAIDYAAIWDVVTQYADIGGMVYVFGPDQPNPNVPNPYDLHSLLPSEYSLLDMHNKPIDDSLAALSAKWKTIKPPTPFPSPTKRP